VRQVHALEHEMNGRERLNLDPAGPQFGLDLGQRDAGFGLHQGAQQILVRLRHWMTMAPTRSGLTEPVSRSRRMSFTAADGMTS
jgi:hypothetical protein